MFERNGTRIKLTPASETLLQYTEQVFAVYRNPEYGMNAFTQQHKGRLLIGASTTVAQYVLPPVPAVFHKIFTNIKATLTIHNTGQTEQDLQSKNTDIGIVEDSLKIPCLNTQYAGNPG